MQRRPGPGVGLSTTDRDRRVQRNVGNLTTSATSSLSKNSTNSSVIYVSLSIVRPEATMGGYEKCLQKFGEETFEKRRLEKRELCGWVNQLGRTAFVTFFVRHLTETLPTQHRSDLQVSFRSRPVVAFPLTGL